MGEIGTIPRQILTIQDGTIPMVEGVNTRVASRESVCTLTMDVDISFQEEVPNEIGSTSTKDQPEAITIERGKSNSLVNTPPIFRAFHPIALHVIQN